MEKDTVLGAAGAGAGGGGLGVSSGDEAPLPPLFERPTPSPTASAMRTITAPASAPTHSVRRAVVAPFASAAVLCTASTGTATVTGSWSTSSGERMTTPAFMPRAPRAPGFSGDLLAIGEQKIRTLPFFFTAKAA